MENLQVNEIQIINVGYRGASIALERRANGFYVRAHNHNCEVVAQSKHSSESSARARIVLLVEFAQSYQV